MLQFKINGLTVRSISSKSFELVPPLSTAKNNIVQTAILPTSKARTEYINGNYVLVIPKWLYDFNIRGKKQIESRLTAI